MASVHNTVSALRSQIFGTIHNPTNARTGAKYLRRPLRGPAITGYYPKLPNLARLNAQIGSNKYANWSGVKAGSLASSSGSGSNSDEQVVGDDASAEASTSSAPVAHRQLGTREEVVGRNLVEVQRRAGAGWLEDEKERVRRTEVEIRHKLGKGPPKKGEGRRSQMKKR